MEIAMKHARIAAMATRLLKLHRRLKRDVEAHSYRDLARTPVGDGDTLERYPTGVNRGSPRRC
jgi:hypothetical protein